MEFPIEVVLFGFLLAMGVVVGRQRDLFSAAMLTGIFSLVSAALFTLMDAVDVAFTEAAVGAGISTFLILATLALTGDTEKETGRSPWPAAAVVSLTGAALIYGTFDMPVYGDAGAAIHQHVGKAYVDRAWTDTGLPNIVTSVLASYRGYDTFGELAVIFTAGIGVMLLLGARTPQIVGDVTSLPPRSRAPYVREMPVVRVVSKAMLPFILLFALYVQAHGDFGPGGGFQAGVIFAAGFVLFGLVWGPGALELFVRHRHVERGMAVGLLLYGGVGVFSFFAGRGFLDYSAIDPEHPAHGQHLGIFLVELGVGVTVSAVMLAIYYAFASRPKVSFEAPS